MCQNIKFNSSLFLAFSVLSVLPITAHEYYLQKKKFFFKPWRVQLFLYALMPFGKV